MVIESVSRSKIIEVLLASPVFGKLDRVVIEALADVLKIKHIQGGHRVFREREASSEILFLVSGGLRVSRRDANGQVLLYNEIRPGMSFGESGLILRQPRTADVTALRDSVLAALSRFDFEALLNRFPLPINQVVVRAVNNHLRHTEGIARRTHAQSFLVVPLHENSGAGEVAIGLAQAFSKMGRTHLLEPPGNLGEIHNGLKPLVQSVEDVAAYQDALEEQSDFLVYEAQSGPTEWSLRAFRQCDQLVFVGKAGTREFTSELERRLKEQPDFSMKRMHLAILHLDGTDKPDNAKTWRKGRMLERVYHLRSKRSGDYARLARFLTGKAVGVVLGGGGAKGFAHVGVLKALSENGVAVDLIGGNSMGALIAAQFACGIALPEIIAQTREFARGGEWPTLPVISLVSGKRVARDLERMFGDLACDGQWIPFFASACNLTKGRTTIQDTGLIWRAVLASNSPAGLFPPVLLDGDMLVDGAILENVPVNGMRSRLGTALERRRGNGTVIAIDVDVQDAMEVDPTLTRLSAWKTLKGHFYPQTHRSPGIADILYRAGHIGGLNQRGRAIAQADHYLEPPVAEFSMMSYRKADEIAEVGYQYAMKNIKEWNLQA